MIHLMHQKLGIGRTINHPTPYITPLFFLRKACFFTNMNASLGIIYLTRWRFMDVICDSEMC